MNTNVKRIGVLTSGGDCAGLNAALRAVVYRAAALGIEVLGIKEGTNGLLSRPPRAETLTQERCDSFMLRQGGTILGTTNKGDPFAFPMDGVVRDLSADIIAGYKLLQLDALIGIGGDGSLSIMQRISKQGNIPFVGIPKTIDNDVGLTENAIGYDTAVMVATEALDRLQPTAASHDRVMVLEVMGRDAGHIALATGIAGGADVILIPEIASDLTLVAKHIKAIRERGRNFALVVVSEAVRAVGDSEHIQQFADGQKRYGGVGAWVAHELARLTGAETRVTVLGHVQRGSSPTAVDRVIAAAFGVAAVDLVVAGKFDRIVAWSQRRVIDVPLAQAVANYQAVDPQDSLVKTARGLGICFGDA